MSSRAAVCPHCGWDIASFPEIPMTSTSSSQSPNIFPGFAQSLGLMGIVIGFQVALGVPVVALKALGYLGAIPYVFFVGQLAAAAGVLAIGASWGKRSYRQFLPFHAVPGRAWMPFLKAQFGITLVLHCVGTSMEHLLPAPAWLNEGMTTMGPIAVVVGAALTEEFLFRGLILGGMVERYSKPKALLGSAFLFAAIHLNPWQFLPSFIAGLWLGWVRTETRSLWLPILGHAVHNGICVLAMRGSIPFMKGSGMPPLWMWTVGGVLIASGVLGMRQIRQVVRPTTPELAA
jgi:membrane protease YdiL (CAAX protease family)